MKFYLLLRTKRNGKDIFEGIRRFREFESFIFYIKLTVLKTVVIADCKHKSESNLDLTRFIQHLPRLESCIRNTIYFGSYWKISIKDIVLLLRMLHGTQICECDLILNSNGALLKFKKFSNVLSLFQKSVYFFNNVSVKCMGTEVCKLLDPSSGKITNKSFGNNALFKLYSTSFLFKRKDV